MEKLYYTIDVEQVNVDIRDVESNCNEITFINLGVPTVYINKMPLTTGQFIVFGGHINEECVTTFKVQANTSGGLYVWRKRYTNKK